MKNPPSEIASADALSELDRKHEQLLEELDQLNLELEAALRAVSGKEPTEREQPSEAPAG